MADTNGDHVTDSSGNRLLGVLIGLLLGLILVAVVIYTAYS